MKTLSCPCCGHTRHLMLRKFDISELSTQWENFFGFNPFIEWSDVRELQQYRCMQCALVFHLPEMLGGDAFYARLSKYDWYYESEKWEFDVALDLIGQFKPKSILEIGCGSGEFLQKVSGAVDLAMGVDINPTALEKARAKGLVVTNQSIELMVEKFDMIVLFEVLEHLPEPGKILRAIVDRLNPGGTLVLAVPNPDGYLKDQGVVLLDLPPHHNTKWSRTTFSYFASSCGLKEFIYAVEPVRYIHYQAYMAAIIASGARRPSVRLIQKIAFKIFGPFLYDLGRRHVLGQTHLVALQKPVA